MAVWWLTNYQPRESGFDSSSCRFEAWAVALNSRWFSSFEYLTECVPEKSSWRWMDRSASVKRFYRCYGLDTAVCKNVSFTFLQELVSQLVQRYLNSQKGRQAEQTVSAGDLEGITQQLKELKQMSRLLLQDAYGENTSLISH